MWLSSFGTLEGWHEGNELRLGGTVWERTPAMLLLDPNQVVPVTRLVEAGHGQGAPPSSAPHQVRRAVAELRQRIPGGASTGS